MENPKPPLSATLACRRVCIERVSGIGPAEFEERFLSGSGKPAIVSDALNSWKARTVWSFDLFKSRYGTETVLTAVWPGNKLVKMVKLGDYIDYLDAPEGKSPGFWIDAETKIPISGPPETPASPPYLNSWSTFDRHPELLGDVQLSPKFIEDWLPALPQALRKALDHATRYFSSGVLIGPAGALSGLHQDFLHTHAYLAQIAGKKKCTLFPPEDSAALYQGRVALDRADLSEFPLFAEATAHECTLEPGELLFIPHNWWHHVTALEKSITVNYNFFNAVNFREYMTDLLARLPAIVDGLEKSPEEKRALGIHWTSKGFESQ